MKLEWESADGKIIEFTDKNKYLLEEWSGLGYPTNIVKSVKSPYQYGDTIISNIINPRLIRLKFSIITDDKEIIFNEKRKVIQAFNPINGAGLLSYTDIDGNIYQIKAVNEQTPKFIDHNTTYQNIELKLKAPDPCWYNSVENSITLAEINNINNSGDIKTPLLITLEGPMSNPEIFNKTTGTKIGINHTISSGEKIEIATGFGNKSVYLFDEIGRKKKAFTLLSFDSYLFNLDVGDNLIEFKASNTDQESKAVIRYRESYLGI